MKKYIHKSEYMKARRNYLRMIKRYEKQGYDISEKYRKPVIPKRPTTSSITNLQRLEVKVKAQIHEQRVDTGYYVRRREQQAIQAKIRKAAQAKPKSNKKQYKKSPISIPTKVPKVKSKQTQPPNLSDAVLRSFESEMTIAKNYVAKSKPFQDAVNEAGHDAQWAFDNKIDEILNKYIPDLTRHDVRVEVAQKLSENFENYMSNIESYLYEFISDGQGHLDHTMAGLASMQELVKAISGAELSIEEKKQLEELANSLADGDIMEGVDEEYDY